MLFSYGIYNKKMAILNGGGSREITLDELTMAYYYFRKKANLGTTMDIMVEEANINSLTAKRLFTNPSDQELLDQHAPASAKESLELFAQSVQDHFTDDQ